MRTVSTVQQYASYFLNRGIQMHTVSTVQQCASCFFNDGIQMSTVSTVQQFASCFLKRGIQMHTVITVQQYASCSPWWRMPQTQCGLIWLSLTVGSTLFWQQEKLARWHHSLTPSPHPLAFLFPAASLATLDQLLYTGATKKCRNGREAIVSQALRNKIFFTQRCHVIQ